MASRPITEHAPCFFEHNPALTLWRRSVAEGVGTLLLMVAVTGAAITGQRLSGGNHELGLLVSALVGSGSLVGLILAFGSVSGGHFNPLITVLQWLAGDRTPRCTIAYLLAQIVGASLGAVLANNLFEQPACEALIVLAPSRWVISEIVASCGLLIIVLGCSRSGNSLTGPFGVGAWLMAAIIATPSASYANPAITIAALFSAGPVAVTNHTAALYIPAQIAGALLAYLIILITYPRTR